MSKIVKMIFLMIWFHTCIYGQTSSIYFLNISQLYVLVSSKNSENSINNGILRNTINNESAKFHFHNDFPEYLQMDKFIHSFGSYALNSISYHGLTILGVNKKKSLIWSGTGSIIIMTSKDLYDGLHYKGFSWTDLMANLLGITCFTGQELLFSEQIIKYKFSFSKSCYTDPANGYLGRNILQNYAKDFNAHSYWLSLNLKKVIPVPKIPAWISIAFGYSANGMYGSIENIDSYGGVQVPETQRYRQFLFSLDIDWSKINTKSKALRFLFYTLNFIKVPFPAIEINTLGNIRGYPIYF